MQNLNNGFSFPVPVQEKVIETGFMREVMNRTLLVHPGNTLWYGESRVGKTTTARHMVQVINEAFHPYNPYAFRAVHYEVGEIQAWSGNEQKKGLKSLYNAALGKIDEGLYRTDPPETIAQQLIVGLMRKNIQQIFIDEAGNLSLEAIRGIIMAYDAAKNMEHPLSDSATNDIDVGVRQSSLWAYGFTTGEKAIQFIEKRSLEDKDVRVRNFARNLIDNRLEEWFSFN